MAKMKNVYNDYYSELRRYYVGIDLYVATVWNSRALLCSYSNDSYLNQSMDRIEKQY